MSRRTADAGCRAARAGRGSAATIALVERLPLQSGTPDALEPDCTDSVILVVDDLPSNIAVLGDLLASAGYRVRAATGGEAALRYAAEAPRPDLVLLDIMMPGMDGYAVLRALRESPTTRDIPVMFVTALGDAVDEERGLRLGAADYIAKPLSPPLVLARVRTQLQAKRARDWLRDQNAALEAEVQRRMRENQVIQAASIRALARLAETRDPETGNHLMRTQAYVHRLAQLLSAHPRFREQLDARAVELIAKSAPLHDIGKVGIPDSILQKPGRLTPEEWEVMKTHARLGGEALARAERDLDEPVPFLRYAKEIAFWHHEHWDGSGYPDGLAGEAIPLSARLMALADVFDALVSPRVYKSPVGFPRTREIIAAERGRQFDPDVVDAFLADYDGFVRIAQRYADPPDALVA